MCNRRHTLHNPNDTVLYHLTGSGFCVLRTIHTMNDVYNSNCEYNRFDSHGESTMKQLIFFRFSAKCIAD